VNLVRTAVIDTATNIVTNVVEFEDAVPPPEEHLPGQLWVACSTVQIGDLWDGASILPKPTQE
jgi:hypothetical protein